MVSPPNSGSLCIRCKGARNLCGRKKCSILEKVKAIYPILPKIEKQDINGASPPSVFVGRYGYPKVRLGPLIPPFSENTEVLDDPESWLSKSIDKIISYRSSLIRSSFESDVYSAPNPDKFLVETQEISMADKSVDMEVIYRKKPKFKMVFSSYFQPLGPYGIVDKMKITENTKIDRKTDYLVSDTDVRAEDATMELYKGGIKVNTISRIFSTGILGQKNTRKLVPTRWSLTAIDDIISKNLIDKIKYFPIINDFEVYHSHRLGNNFYILLIPTFFGFENLEAWFTGSLWSQGKTTNIVSDFETEKGRKTYASNVTGAYYSARLGICENLVRKRRQARAIVFREVYDDYLVPLGCWQIRENLRNAMKSNFLKFNTLGESLNYIATKLKIPIRRWLKNSKLIELYKTQSTLDQFM